MLNLGQKTIVTKCKQTNPIGYTLSRVFFVLVLMEMVVNVVSTRKVSNITEELCGVSFSQSTVSQLCQPLHDRLR
jgi:putative transposase